MWNRPDHLQCWLVFTLFFHVTGLGGLSHAVVQSAPQEAVNDVGIVASFVAIGCGIAAALALGIGPLLLYRPAPTIKRHQPRRRK